MKISDLTPTQIREYFSTRIQGRLYDRPQQLVRCPFHQDRSPSMSLHLDKGIWNCHAGCGHGGMIDFEMQYSNCDKQTAVENIHQAIGAEYTRSLYSSPDAEPEAIYDYRDAVGNLLFQKLRFRATDKERKTFRQRRLTNEGQWEWKLPEGEKPLYNLPVLITANQAIICEGEKDCDNVAALHLEMFDDSKTARYVTTTNFDGAGKWRPSYGAYFAGKTVAILRDNDTVGKIHGEQVAASILPYAHSVRIVDLPGLEEHGDVSDYLQSHTAEDLLNEMFNTTPWQPKASELLVPAPEFLSHQDEEIDWIVDRIIQRGASGFFAANPKVGKSWSALGLALSLALGRPWLGFSVQRVRTALITREDAPGLTRWRMWRLLRGLGETEAELADWLYINSREQSKQFKLANPEQLAAMTAALQHFRPEVVILDVFNVMHSTEENDNSEMRKILDRVEAIRNDIGCAFAIVHHFGKDKERRLTERMRGASATAGFAEWVIGLRFASDSKTERRRIMEFELKAAEPPDPICFTIESNDEDRRTELVRQAEVPREETASVFGRSKRGRNHEDRDSADADWPSTQADA